VAHEEPAPVYPDRLWGGAGGWFRFHLWRHRDDLHRQLFNGLWIAFIGWFLENAALSSYRQVAIEDILKAIPPGKS